MSPIGPGTFGTRPFGPGPFKSLHFPRVGPSPFQPGPFMSSNEQGQTVHLWVEITCPCGARCIFLFIFLDLYACVRGFFFENECAWLFHKFLYDNFLLSTIQIYFFNHIKKVFCSSGWFWLARYFYISISCLASSHILTKTYNYPFSGWVVVLAGMHSCHFYFVLAIQPKLNSSQSFSSSIFSCNDQNLWFRLKLWFSHGLNEMCETGKLVYALDFFFLRKGKTDGEGAISCLFYKNLPPWLSPISPNQLQLQP